MLTAVPVLRRGSWHVSLDCEPAAVAGTPPVSLAPEVMIRADARHLRERRAPAPLSAAERATIVAAAWDRFTTGQVTCGDLGSQDYPAFQSLLWQAAGLPAVLVDRWCAMLTAALAGLLRSPGLPRPASLTRPELTLVALPGNTFTCLASVFAAALSGAAVWIRPSTREPFSALRLTAALLAEGWPAELLGFYPCRQSTVQALVEVTDQQVVYGGADVAAALDGRPTAVVHGPLRVCAVVTEGSDPAGCAAALEYLIAADAGRFCTAVRVILCRTDPGPVAARLGSLLDAIPLHPPDRRLPMTAAVDRDRAVRIATTIESGLAGSTAAAARVTRRPVLTQAGELTFLAPTLISLPARFGGEPSWSRVHPLFGFEAPFPCAVIMPVTAGQAASLASQADLTHRVAGAGPGGPPS